MVEWISPVKRIAIYNRDRHDNGRLYCYYCGQEIIFGAGRGENIRTLDHIVPQSHNGSNRADNLISCCAGCNSRRGNMPIIEWMKFINGDIDDLYARLSQKLDRNLIKNLTREYKRNGRQYMLKHYAVVYNNGIL